MNYFLRVPLISLNQLFQFDLKDPISPLFILNKLHFKSTDHQRQLICKIYNLLDIWLKNSYWLLFISSWLQIWLPSKYVCIRDPDPLDPDFFWIHGSGSKNAWIRIQKKIPLLFHYLNSLTLIYSYFGRFMKSEEFQ